MLLWLLHRVSSGTTHSPNPSGGTGSDIALTLMVAQGQTALHIACREHHHDLARVLLEHGCDPNLKEDVMVRAAHVDYTCDGPCSTCRLHT